MSVCSSTLSSLCSLSFLRHFRKRREIIERGGRQMRIPSGEEDSGARCIGGGGDGQLIDCAEGGED